ncbi:MAG TPA: EI24 domain-containing protein [Noviherbaspirillum sp.]|nr:EI24 domain-containing protein [Noviherbaspirillum sp.]
MRPILIAFGRAVLSQLHLRMLLLTILPFLLSIAIWGVLLWLFLEPMVDWLHAWFSETGHFATAGGVLEWMGLGALKTLVVPLIAMWVLLPLMVLTALLCVGVFAMPVIVGHVSRRHFPELEKRRGGSFLGSIWVGASSFLLFALLWVLTLPLTLIPPLTFIIQPLLWGWLTYRVIAYDALAEHASKEEHAWLMRVHRWPLLAIGAIAGAMGAAPAMLWLGGALLILFPVLAAGAIWLYVLVFVFSGLWFQHYCLQALATYRALYERDTQTLPAIAQPER